MLLFCLQITTAQNGLTTQERQNWVKKYSLKKKMLLFCLQITTAQIGLTTQERQNSHDLNVLSVNYSTLEFATLTASCGDPYQSNATENC